jgi:hypothetical protein
MQMPVIGFDDCQSIHSVIDLSGNLTKDIASNYDMKNQHAVNMRIMLFDIKLILTAVTRKNYGTRVA